MLAGERDQTIVEAKDRYGITAIVMALGGEQQRMDLAHRAIDAPALAQVAPLQDELLHGLGEGVFKVSSFCHDRNYRPKGRPCQVFRVLT